MPPHTTRISNVIMILVITLFAQTIFHNLKSSPLNDSMLTQTIFIQSSRPLKLFGVKLLKIAYCIIVVEIKIRNCEIWNIFQIKEG
jgi:hypothetical protein